MVNCVKVVFFVILVLVVVSILYENGADARGGRGGGRFGRSGRSWGSRGRVRSRTRNSYASRVRSNLGSSLFNWKTAAVAGSIYGWHRYSSSPRYHRYPDRRPTICVNIHDYKTDNGTRQDMFICPFYNQSDDYKYCCGAEDKQYCCKLNGGHIAGIVVGVLLLICVCALVIYCACCRKQKKMPGFIHKFSKKEPGAKYAMTNTQPEVGDMAASYPQQNVVPPYNTPYPPASGPDYPVAPLPTGELSPYPPPPQTNDYPVAPMGEVTPYPPAQYPVEPPMPSTGHDVTTPYPTAPVENNSGHYPNQSGNLPYPADIPPPVANQGYPTVAPPPYPQN